MVKVKIITFLFLLLGACSCNNRISDETLFFSQIDLTYINPTGGDVKYIHVDSLGGIVVKSVYVKNEPEIYNKGILPDSILKKINRLTDSILKAKLDSVYIDSIPDLAYFNLMVRSNQKRQTIYARANINIPQHVNDLVSILTRYAYKNKLKRVDTAYQFETTALSIEELERKFKEQRKRKRIPLKQY